MTLERITEFRAENGMEQEAAEWEKVCDLLEWAVRARMRGAERAKAFRENRKGGGSGASEEAEESTGPRVPKRAKARQKGVSVQKEGIPVKRPYMEKADASLGAIPEGAGFKWKAPEPRAEQAPVKAVLNPAIAMLKTVMRTAPVYDLSKPQLKGGKK